MFRREYVKQPNGNTSNNRTEMRQTAEQKRVKLPNGPCKAYRNDRHRAHEGGCLQDGSHGYGGLRIHAPGRSSRLPHWLPQAMRMLYRRASVIHLIGLLKPFYEKS